jgi:hypothetical protein
MIPITVKFGHTKNLSFMLWHVGISNQLNGFVSLSSLKLALKIDAK